MMKKKNEKKNEQQKNENKNNENKNEKNEKKEKNENEKQKKNNILQVSNRSIHKNKLLFTYATKATNCYYLQDEQVFSTELLLDLESPWTETAVYLLDLVPKHCEKVWRRLESHHYWSLLDYVDLTRNLVRRPAAKQNNNLIRKKLHCTFCVVSSDTTKN